MLRNYCKSWPSGQNLRIFSENSKNLGLSGQNGNFDYKFNDHKDVAEKTGFLILYARPRPTVLS